MGCLVNSGMFYHSVAAPAAIDEIYMKLVETIDVKKH